MSAPLTMAEIMSATGHTIVNPDVLTRAEDLALRMVTGPRRRTVQCDEVIGRVSMRLRTTASGRHVAVIKDEVVGLDAAEEVAITLLALVAVARRDGNG